MVGRGELTDKAWSRIEPLLPPVAGRGRYRRFAAMRERRIPFTCPERADRIKHRRAKGSAGGRPPPFDPAVDAGRNVVERCFNRLTQFRDLATRYARRAAYYRAEIIGASIVLWLRSGSRDAT